jgi:hypothetical protein
MTWRMGSIVILSLTGTSHCGILYIVFENRTAVIQLDLCGVYEDAIRSRSAGKHR